MKHPYPEKQLFELQEVIETSSKNFFAQGNYKHIAIQKVDDLVAPLSLYGEKKILLDVLNILLTAAAEFVDATKIIISVKQLLQTEKDVLLEFSVIDNGLHISQTPEKGAFAYKRRLLSARSLLEQCGGISEINSLAGTGTTFKFLIKYTKGSPSDSRPFFETKLSGKRVLVAEDNELNQRTIAHLLKREGILVDIASDGREAIELLEKNQHYDLLILDLQMPYLDGFQSANYIRKKLKNNIPILALTAGFYPNSAERAYEVGINHFILKPLKPQELMKEVYSLLLNQPFIA